MEDVNLKAMCTIKEEFGVNVGYSDHTLGIGTNCCSCNGCNCYREALYIGRSMVGPDHATSLERTN